MALKTLKSKLCHLERRERERERERELKNIVSSHKINFLLCKQ